MFLPLETTTIRPRKLILLLPLLMLLPVIYFLTNKQITPIPPYALLIPAVFSLGFWLALRKTELTIDNEGFRYQTLFKIREVSWKEVQRTYIKYQHKGKSGGYYWFFDTGIQTFNFSVSMFSRKDLRLIAEAVVEKCAYVEIEERIKNIAEGRFPWYIF